MNSSDSRAVTEHLKNIRHVQDVLVLDAGKCVLLIISTGGYSTYMPQQGIKVVTEQEALSIADNYWHKSTLEKAIKEFR